MWIFSEIEVQKLRRVPQNLNFCQTRQLVVVVLTGDTDGFGFTLPGAMGKARRMAKALHSLKLFLLKDKINRELDKNSLIMKFR